jgi:zinc D-Ala-D-Ala carboxypeptidase
MVNFKISKYFLLHEEVLDSPEGERAGLDNTPDMETLVTLVRAADKMDLIRDLLKLPIIITSWFRTLPVNRHIGSKNDNSQHIRGEAIDFKCPAFGTPVEVCRFLIAHRNVIGYDQLILEYSWVHVSFAINPSRTPRLEVLTLLSDGSYAAGLTDLQGNVLP